MISATSTAPTTPQNPNPPLLFISAPPFSYRAVKFRFSIVYYNIALIYVSIPDERPPFYLKCCQDETPLISLIQLKHRVIRDIMKMINLFLEAFRDEMSVLW